MFSLSCYCHFGVGILTSSFKIPAPPRYFDIFKLKFAQNGFWGWNFEDLTPDSESASPRYHMRHFSDKLDNFKFLGLSLKKLPICVWYFGSHNVEGVAEGWVEVNGARWRWIELGARFSNTLLKITHLCSSLLFFYNDTDSRKLRNTYEE